MDAKTIIAIVLVVFIVGAADNRQIRKQKEEITRYDRKRAAYVDKPPSFHIWRQSMKNLKTIEAKVKAILQKNEDARNDDMTLYLIVCNTYLKGAGAMPFAEVMEQYKYLGLPKVSRAWAEHAVSCKQNIQSLWGTPV